VSFRTEPPAASRYFTVIGLEVHAQLLTKSKMYCSCDAGYANQQANTTVCPVCLGLPGALPVINRRAIEFTVMTGLALNCAIAETTRFDRKNYFYPDLMKNYQISQYDMPLCGKGWLDVEVADTTRRIGITRVHLEEDTARLTHRSEGGRPYSLVDVNRAGAPLMEIVSEPDIRDPEEARQYLIKLRSILQFLGVSTGSMEDGSFRCDANISLMPAGSASFGAKVEIKNMNSFRSVFRALEFEVGRQAKALVAGERIVQETRGWDDDRGTTISQRTKEHAHDYRYFPEPDLPPLSLTREWVDGIRARLPELQDAARERFVEQYKVSHAQAAVATSTAGTASYLTDVLSRYPRNAGGTIYFYVATASAHMNSTGEAIETLSRKLGPDAFAELFQLQDTGQITAATAKSVFEESLSTGGRPAEIIRARGLTQVSDADALGAFVDQALAAHPNVVQDYLGGKAQALGFLVGQVMRLTKGKANPGIVNKLLAERIGQRQT
jgi:aspartyl-tRNA(Asn)/glutamyl-tRNA(Gln) amidotransferase subunit B